MLSWRSAKGLPAERYRTKPPKNGKERYVDVGSEVVAVLRAEKACHAERKLAAGENWRTETTTSDGTLLEWGDLVISDAYGFPWWPLPRPARHVRLTVTGRWV